MCFRRRREICAKLKILFLIEIVLNICAGHEVVEREFLERLISSYYRFLREDLFTHSTGRTPVCSRSHPPWAVVLFVISVCSKNNSLMDLMTCFVNRRRIVTCLDLLSRHLESYVKPWTNGKCLTPCVGMFDYV